MLEDKKEIEKAKKSFKKDIEVNKEEEVVVVAVNRGVMISALEFALMNKYSVGIARAIAVLDPSYKEDHYQDIWKVIFEAFITKPANCIWKDYYNDYRRRK